VTLMQPICKRT